MVTLRPKSRAAQGPDTTAMQITYIFHSGFAVEGESAILLFDIWHDPSGSLPRLLSLGKPVYVFASHFHDDHFSRRIFDWRKSHPATPITYILSKDILRHRRAKAGEADVWLAKGGEWRDGIVWVRAAGSTDSGVSWIVELEGKTLFHAGDLNNWYAKFLTDDYDGGNILSQEFGVINPLHEEMQYLGELKDIRKLATEFDIAFFPVDGRIGNGYTRGARQFVSTFKVRHFIPMHFVVSGFESAWRMRPFAEEKGAQFWSISREGETLTIL